MTTEIVYTFSVVLNAKITDFRDSRNGVCRLRWRSLPAARLMAALSCPCARPHA